MGDLYGDLCLREELGALLNVGELSRDFCHERELGDFLNVGDIQYMKISVPKERQWCYLG